MIEKKLSEFRYLNQESQRELIEELNLSVSLFREMLDMLKAVLATEHLKGTIEESKIKRLIKKAKEI